MKIGVLTGLWFLANGATLMESLRHVAHLGFHYVDLHGVFHAGPKHLSLEDARHVKREMQLLGLRPRNYVCHSPHNIPSAAEAELEESYEYLKRAIDLALLWDINQVMLNAGMWAYGTTREEAWSRSVRFIQRVCDYAAPRGVYVTQEAEPYVWYLVNDIASTIRMMEDVDRPNIATLIDLGHMGLAREGPKDLRRLGESIIHAHLSDHQAFRHTNQTLGTGFVSLPEYLGELVAMRIDERVRRFGYEELVVSMELGSPGDRIENPDDVARQSVDYLLRTASHLGPL